MPRHSFSLLLIWWCRGDREKKITPQHTSPLVFFFPGFKSKTKKSRGGWEEKQHCQKEGGVRECVECPSFLVVNCWLRSPGKVEIPPLTDVWNFGSAKSVSIRN